MRGLGLLGRRRKGRGGGRTREILGEVAVDWERNGAERARDWARVARLL